MLNSQMNIVLLVKYCNNYIIKDMQVATIVKEKRREELRA